MAAEIRNLSPQHVWGYFHDLTQIPRPTGHMDAVTRYILAFGKESGLETLQDKTGNIVIRKPATPGMEHCKTVIIQGHLDMVPQKNAATVHNFETDPIDAYIDGDWVTARDTTLGADNGIGVALALAVLSDNTLKHGPVEALFTVDEEVGMDGAFGLKPGFLKGEILINADSEEEGELFVGCAGGADLNISFQFKEDIAIPEGDVAVKLSLTGLKGGHSGVDIHLGRANANKLMFRFLKEAVRDYGARLSSIDGGSLRNAIPREAVAIITIPGDNVEALWELVADYQDMFRTEYQGIAEPDYGIITNVGKAHLEGFGSFEGVIKTKGELYDFLRKKDATTFIHHDNPYLMNISQGLNLISYGTEDDLYVNGRLPAIRLILLSNGKPVKTVKLIKSVHN
jgi:dipeptidase D